MNELNVNAGIKNTGIESDVYPKEKEMSTPKQTGDNIIQEMERAVKGVDNPAEAEIIMNGYLAGVEPNKLDAMLAALGNKKIAARLIGKQVFTPNTAIISKHKMERIGNAKIMMEQQYDMASLAVMGQPYAKHREQMVKALEPPPPSKLGLDNMRQPEYLQQVEDYKAKDHLIFTMATAGIGSIVDGLAGSTGRNKKTSAMASAMDAGVQYTMLKENERIQLQNSIATKNASIQNAFSLDFNKRLDAYDTAYNDLEKEHIKNIMASYEVLQKERATDAKVLIAKNKRISADKKTAATIFGDIDSVEIDAMKVDQQGKRLEYSKNIDIKLGNQSAQMKAEVANAKRNEALIGYKISMDKLATDGLYKSSGTSIQEQAHLIYQVGGGLASTTLASIARKGFTKTELDNYGFDAAIVADELGNAIVNSCQKGWFNWGKDECRSNATNFVLQLSGQGYRISGEMIETLGGNAFEEQVKVTSSIDNASQHITGATAARIKRLKEQHQRSGKKGNALVKVLYSANLIDTVMRDENFGNQPLKVRKAILASKKSVQKFLIGSRGEYDAGNIHRNDSIARMSALNLPVVLQDLINKDKKDSIKTLYESKAKASK